ncbi:MAG: glycosyltransferase [Gammaproteobacteria bacterium]|nr:glycosyltransferase [Gammaproteobacteria bacterium]
MSIAESSCVLLPIVPEAGVVTGVGTWVNTLVATQDDIRVLPLAMNVHRVCHITGAAQVDWQASHRIDRLDAHLDALVDGLPSGTRIFVAPGWGELAYHAAARLVMRHRNARLLAVCHTDDVSYYRTIGHFVGYVGAIVGVSRHLVQALRYRFPGTTVARMHHPVVTGETPVRRAGEAGGRLNLLYAGRLNERQKRVSRLLEVAVELRARGVAFRLSIAGEGAAGAELQDGFAAAGFDDTSVRFLGLVSRERMSSLFAENELFLMTSDYEGSPLGLLEAMAAGLVPVVMAVSSGIDEVVEDGVNGCLVPRGDSAAMAHRIGDLAAQPGRRAQLAERARSRILTLHRPQRCWSQLRRVMRLAWQHGSPTDDEAVDPFAAPIRDLLARLDTAGIDRVAVYGAGMFGRCLVDALLAGGIRVAALLDGDPAKQDRVYRGLRVQVPSSAALDHAVGTLVLGSLAAQDEMIDRINSIAPDRAPAILRPPVMPT